MSEDVLGQWLPVILPLMKAGGGVAIVAGVVVIVLWAREVEQLADRLRRLCESTGRPEIRTLRPRRQGLSLDLRALERTLLSLEGDQGIPSRRVPNYRNRFLMRDMEKRISRLEERGFR